MLRLAHNKHFVNTVAGLIKFSLALGLLALLVVKVPEQASQIVATAALVFGGAKLGSKLGL